MLDRYRPWFYAAAVYNFVWGVFVVLFPLALFRWLDMRPPESPAIFQSVGMMVGVYAYGYYLLARDPERYSGFIWIGILGKTFGPIGFFWSAFHGVLPWSFGWTILTNDLLWWPVFWRFALKHARHPLAPISRS